MERCRTRCVQNGEHPILAPCNNPTDLIHRFKIRGVGYHDKTSITATGTPCCSKEHQSINTAGAIAFCGNGAEVIINELVERQQT